jgi:hypothetical protein
MDFKKVEQRAGLDKVPDDPMLMLHLQTDFFSGSSRITDCEYNRALILGYHIGNKTPGIEKHGL